MSACHPENKKVNLFIVLCAFHAWFDISKNIRFKFVYWSWTKQLNDAIHDLIWDSTNLGEQGPSFLKFSSLETIIQPPVTNLWRRIIWSGINLTLLFARSRAVRGTWPHAGQGRSPFGTAREHCYCYYPFPRIIIAALCDWAGETHMLTYTSPPLLDRRAPRGLLSRFRRGVYEWGTGWHSSGEGRFNNVSTTRHLNDSEGSILRSHARRNCLMVLHQFFFVCAWRVPLRVTWWSCLFTRACLLTQIKPGIHHNTPSTGIPNVCAKVRLSWILSGWNYK